MNPTVNADLSFLTLLAEASLVVKGVMLVLVLMSVVSWWMIFVKLFAIRQAARKSERFERLFWSGSDLASLAQQVAARHAEPEGMELIFKSGYEEFLKLKRQSHLDVKDVLEGTRRAMRAEYQRELDRLESHLAFLATVGSVSPYIGLFGTVWGIMNSFRGLANVGQATLAHVAPGIAEALIATAIGLFAAIPAVIAYNRFVHDLDRLANRCESFMEEFSNILQRHSVR